MKNEKLHPTDSVCSIRAQMSDSVTSFFDDDEEGGFRGGVGTYDGERNENAERHGFGVATLPSGDVYEGNYLNGKRNGRGKYLFANNAR